jgi:hypothetical protein
MLSSAQNNFFDINLQPFCNRLITHHHPTQLTASLRSRQFRSISINTIKYYKSLLPSSQPLVPILLLGQWKRFWSISISLSARTVWYRCIHEKLPTKHRLHRLISDSHPSSLCSTCTLSIEEDDSHFLFLCPPKLAVWQSIFTTYIQSQPDQLLFSLSVSQILSFSSSLTRATNLPLPELDVQQIFACTLLSIWQAHWRLVFNNVLFSSANIITCISRLLTRLDSEHLIDLD